MKELSIEEKAKRYDEALERAKLSRLQLLDIGEEATEIEHIFPELKESEDERIRGALINHIQYQLGKGEFAFGGWRKSDIITWLEKQKSVEEWSEKDEYIVQLIEAIIDDKLEDCSKESTMYRECNNVKSWLRSLRTQNNWKEITKDIYVSDVVLAQKKDKSDSFNGYVICADHTLKADEYERYILLSGNIS